MKKKSINIGRQQFQHCQQNEQYNHLSLQTIARTQKDYNIIMVQKCMSWIGTGTNMWRGLSIVEIGMELAHKKLSLYQIIDVYCHDQQYFSYFMAVSLIVYSQTTIDPSLSTSIFIYIRLYQVHCQKKKTIIY